MASRPQHLRQRRRAVAPLELALCLPVLLVLIISIVWLGFSVVGQSAVAVQARQAAWKKRFDARGTALLFLKDDFVTEKAVGKVEVTPLLDDMSPPTSSHDVMIGTWDYHELALDKAPNLKEYALAATNAKTGSVQVGYTDVSNQFNSWKQISQDAWRTVGQSLLQELTSLGGLAESSLGAAQQEQSDTTTEAAQLDRQISRRKADIEQAKAKLRQLEDEKRQAESEEAQQSLTARIEIQRNKVKRLENDLRNLKSDRKELD